MWIIPNNHPLYYQQPQDRVVSREDLKEHFINLVGLRRKPSLMWRSKRSAAGTWLSRWNKVYWIRRLFGRTLKPSHGHYFETKYTSLLADIHVSHFPSQGNKKGSRIPGTYGPTTSRASQQLALWEDFSKTSGSTSITDIEKSETVWKSWITQLSKEYIQRKRLALLIKERDCFFSPWTTPIATNWVRSQETLKKCLDFRKRNSNQTTIPLYLPEQVIIREKKKWTTPVSDDTTIRRQKYKQGGSALSYQSSQWDKASRSTTGNSLVLSPAWTFQLMGTTLQKTFCAWQETPWWSKQLNSHS